MFTLSFSWSSHVKVYKKNIIRKIIIKKIIVSKINNNEHIYKDYL